MTIYVDGMRAIFRRMKMCHMIADSSEELHAMAACVGVKRQWCQHEGTAQEHYDIALSKRALAVAAGAVEINQRTLATMAWRRRVDGVLGKPGKTEQWLTNYWKKHEPH